MKIKPKEVLINVPVALLFDESWEIISFAANINTILHGKVKIKVEELGCLGGRFVGLFYLQRNDEYHQIRDEFIRLIEQEEISTHSSGNLLTDKYDPDYGDDVLCECGHTYYRHFDSYAEMSPVGCKYCILTDTYRLEEECAGFKKKIKLDAPEHELCLDCDKYMMLHQKGQDHCVCGHEWINNKCELM